MKAAIQALWRWSWLLTLPVTIALFHWVLVTGDRYSDFGVQYRPTEDPFRLWNVGRMEFGHMLRELGRIVRLTPAARSVAGSSGSRVVSLYIPEAGLAQLDSDLPHSGFEYVDGGLWQDDEVREVKLRYRGDNIYHWGYYKKSWRVRTKRASLYDGMRTFNLVAPRTPEIINNHLSYRLGSLMGIVSPRSEVVEVAVNGRPTGVYVLTEQLSEITLRRHGLMPGDLYSGDVVARDTYVGMPNQLFEFPSLWEKVAFNNHYDEGSIKPLQRLIDLVRAPQTDATQEQLVRLVDLEAFARFSALETLTATVHIDAVHNWRLYFDPARSLFVPVLWDPVGWHSGILPAAGYPVRLDVVTSPLHLALHRNGDFLRAKHRALKDFFATGQDRAFMEELDRTTAVLVDAWDRDPNLVTTVDVLTPGEAQEALSRLKSGVQSVFRGVRDGYLGQGDQVFFAPIENDSIAFLVVGRKPVFDLSLRYALALSNPVSATLTYWRHGRPIERDVSRSVGQTGGRVHLNCELLARFVPSIESMTPGLVMWNSLEVQPGYYELDLEGIGADNHLLEVLADRGGDQLEPAVLLPHVERNSFDGMFAAVRERPVPEPLVVQGEVVVDRILELDQQVILAPGTTLRMEPGASLIFRGRVWADGTAEQPIRVLPARQGQEPWGTFALQGQGASGSMFSHCEFSGGSGFKGDLFEYSAMFSIHDVDGVTVDHCRFSDSKLVDDMVHAVYAKVRFSDCEFEGALLDAVDLDISEGVVERCRFQDSGNDGLDLMTSRVVVLDTTLQGNGDKGISVGEGTTLLAIGCRFEGNTIGVESKDRSVAVLYNADLVGNGLALNAYDKNWQYEGGGFTYVYKSRMLDNATQIEAQKGSGTWLYDTYVDRPLDPDTPRLVVDETVDSDSGVAARVPSMWRFPGEQEWLGGFAEEYWSQANPAGRGAVSIGR